MSASTVREQRLLAPEAPSLAHLLTLDAVPDAADAGEVSFREGCVVEGEQRSSLSAAPRVSTLRTRPDCSVCPRCASVGPTWKPAASAKARLLRG